MDMAVAQQVLSDVSESLGFSPADRDRVLAYWDAYYASCLDARGHLTPSDFCRFSIAGLRATGCVDVVDLGCGNGRDAVYLAEQGFRVVGVDQARSALVLADALAAERGVHVSWVQGDFSRYCGRKPTNVYSRFALHAVTDADQYLLLKNARRMVSGDCRLFLEARTTKHFDPEPDGHKESWDGNHYRRYLHVPTLCRELTEAGFDVEYLRCGTGLAVLPGVEDPHIVRIVAR